MARKRHRQDSPDSDPTQNATSTLADTTTFEISQDDPKKKPIKCERHDPRRTLDSSPDLFYTHGAGGNLSTPAAAHFIEGFTTLSSLVGFQGNMNMKARLNGFGTVISKFAHPGSKVNLGGRSMGARAAALLAGSENVDVGDGCQVDHLVLVNFPLKTDKGNSREDVLLGIKQEVKVLFIAGTKDTMCSLEELMVIMGRLQCTCWVLVVDGADHGMSVSSGDRNGANRELRMKTGIIAAQWLEGHMNEDDSRYRNIAWDIDEKRVVDGGWESMPRLSKASPGRADVQQKGSPSKDDSRSTHTRSSKRQRKK